MKTSSSARLWDSSPQVIGHRGGRIDGELIRIVGTVDPDDLPQDLEADRLHRLDPAAPLALGALGAEHVLQALPGALAGHLHQPELGEAVDVGLGAVFRQRQLQAVEHPAAVIFRLHVDEVDDDDAAEVAQPQVAGDGGGGLDVGVEDGLFQVAMAHEGTCVDVHRGHGFGLVDDEVAAGFQLHLALQGALDLVLHVVEIEDGRLAGVVLQLVCELGHILPGEVREQLEALARVDPDLVELGADEVAHHPEGQAGILVEDLAGRVLLLALQDLAPQPLQEGGVLLQLLLPHPFGGGADDVATQLVHIARYGALEAFPLSFGLDALGNADVGTARHEDQVAGRQCDVGGETGTLGAQGSFTTCTMMS